MTAVLHELIEGAGHVRARSARARGRGHKEWLHFSAIAEDVEVIVNFSVLDGVARVALIARAGGGFEGDVEAIPPEHARIGPGARVLLRTDWDAHAELPDYRTHFPRLSREVAQWLAARGVWLVGVQTPSVASLADREELRDVHQILLRGSIVIVECLANLAQLPTEVTFIALPLKVQGGDGSPVRAVAIS